MGCQCFTSSRELFEAARQAAIDADRCRRQLEAMEHRALSVGRPSLEAHVSGGGDPDRIGRDVAAMMGVSVSYAQKMVRAAFDIADANGLAATVAGTGLAEG